MANYTKMYQVLQGAVENELPTLQRIPKAEPFIMRVQRIIKQDNDIKSKYAVLCSAVSSGIDELADIPYVCESIGRLLSALEEAEEIYISTTLYLLDS